MSRSESAGVAGDAAGVPDGARAAELIEQPLGAELRVLDLVVVEVPGVRIGDVAVDRDGLDAGRRSLGQCRVEGLRVVRVEDDGVDALGDQGPDVGQLAGGIRVAMDHGEVGDLAGRLGLRLGGADLLLAEAVADAAAVRVADRVLLRRADSTGQPSRRGDGAVVGAAASPRRSVRSTHLSWNTRPRSPRRPRSRRAIASGWIP